MDPNTDLLIVLVALVVYALYRCGCWARGRDGMTSRTQELTASAQAHFGQHGPDARLEKFRDRGGAAADADAQEYSELQKLARLGALEPTAVAAAIE